jgi:hypothetical protein
MLRVLNPEGIARRTSDLQRQRGKNILFLDQIISGLLMGMISWLLGALRYMQLLMHILEILSGFMLAYRIVRAILYFVSTL